jgi:hypothetical protein
MRCFRPGRRHLLSAVGVLAAGELYFLVLAVSDLHDGRSGWGLAGIGAGAFWAFWIVRVVSVQVCVGEGVVRSEGLVGGWVVTKDRVRDVVGDRSLLFGHPTLSLLLDDGSMRKLPLLVAGLPDQERAKLRRVLLETIATPDPTDGAPGCWR